MATNSKAQQVQSDLDHLKQEHPGLNDINATEIKEAIQGTENLVRHHQNRLGKLEKLKELLQNIVQDTNNWSADASVLGEHLFKMQVIANILENHIQDGTLKQDEIPERFFDQTTNNKNNKSSPDSQNINHQQRRPILLTTTINSASLKEASSKLSQTLSLNLAKSNKIHIRLIQLDHEIKKTIDLQQDAAEQLKRLKETRESTQLEKEWEENLYCCPFQ